jgi:hypothetical protein
MMGKMTDKDTIEVRPQALRIRPIDGWSWYCGYHDTYGIGDDEDEVLFMAGAHMHYKEVDGDVCELTTRQHSADPEPNPRQHVVGAPWFNKEEA